MVLTNGTTLQNVKGTDEREATARRDAAHPKRRAQRVEPASAILRSLDAVLTTQRRFAPTNTDARGFTLVATLVLVVILGVLATVVLSGEHPSATTGTGASTLPGTASTMPQNAGTDADLAARAACESDFLAVTAALNDYRTLNGAAPSSGISWATAKAHGGPYLTTWPGQTRYFSITWNGAILSVVPTTGASSHGNVGTRSPKTGCYAT